MTDHTELIARLKRASNSTTPSVLLVREAAAALEEADGRVRELEGAAPAELRAAIAVGDGTLHGAIDYWQARAERAEAEIAAVRRAWDEEIEHGKMVVAERDKAYIELNRLHANELPGGWTAELEGQIEARHKAEAERDAAMKDADYFRWRLKEILPLFEEARDALCAIRMPSAKLHGLDLSLGDRMDAAGTRTREQFDAAIAATEEPKNG